MAITSIIADGEGRNGSAGVEHTEEFGSGLKVYAYEGNPLAFQSKNLVNSDYGADLNQDVTASGTPDSVHDGIDSVLWTGANVVGGKGTFNSTDRAYAGTNSVKWDNPALNDIIEFDKGSNMSVGSYVSLVMHVNIDKDWNAGDSIEIYGYDSGTASTIGVSVLMEDYLDITTFDSWQSVVIPLSDMGLTSGTIDGLRMKLIGKAGKAPKLYMDEIAFQEAGSSIVYSAGPPKGKIWRITHLTYVLVDAYAGTVTGGTMQSVPYDGFLGVSTLPNGTNIRRVQHGETRFSATFTDMIDYISTAAPKKILSGSDGVNTWVRLEAEFINPIIFDGDAGDRYELVINDDLSGLLYYRASLSYGEEIKQ